MSDDNRMDDLIRAAAAGYNRPPAVPRDEMWTAIEAAQSSKAGAGSKAPPALYVVPAGESTSPALQAERSSTGPRFAWWGMAAAAALLVATGVGVGRWTTTEADDAATPPAVATSVIQDDAEPPFSPPPLALAPSPAHGEGAGTSTVRASRSRTPEGRRAKPPVARTRASQSVIPYQVATIRHLTDAEALLTSFTLESRSERTDAQLAGWAKGLLSNTRLLLDSPAGDDARRARLLEDLELVLAQIVQLSPGAAIQERDLINGSIQNGAMMTRLRTAIPAGPTRGF